MVLMIPRPSRGVSGPGGLNSTSWHYDLYGPGDLRPPRVCRPHASTPPLSHPPLILCYLVHYITYVKGYTLAISH
jgi:hypothetical protein